MGLLEHAPASGVLAPWAGRQTSWQRSSSVAGLIYIGQQGGASNTLGTDITFQVYAALMIGGYSIIRGGVGNPLGGAMGLLVIAGVTEIIDLKGINTYYTDVVIGALLLAAVFLDRLRGGDSFE